MANAIIIGNMTINKTEKSMVITIDLTKPVGVSKSGKNTLLASTKGAGDLGDNIKLNLNLYTPVR